MTDPRVWESGVDEDPFAEGADGGGERFADAVGDELCDVVAGQFDDQVAGAVVARGEESARDTQAREAHHGAGRHLGMGERGGAHLVEEVGGRVRRQWPGADAGQAGEEFA